MVVTCQTGLINPFSKRPVPKDKPASLIWKIKRAETEPRTRSKHSQPLSKINVNPHPKGQFTSVPFTPYIMFNFQQKLTILKGEKHSLKRQSKYQN